MLDFSCMPNIVGNTILLILTGFCVLGAIRIYLEGK